MRNSQNRENRDNSEPNRDLNVYVIRLERKTFHLKNVGV